MKKILCFLFVLISCNIFAWKTVEIVDEFKEPTGQVRIVLYDKTENSFVSIDKEKKGLEIGFFSKEFIGGKGKYDTSIMKIKIDDNNPISVTGEVWPNGRRVSATLPPKLLELMKKGKVMKAVIQKYNDETILLVFDIEGFSEAVGKVK